MIELKNVWKIYNQGKVSFAAVKNMSLKIEEGDFAVIMGPSGSGKSTMMSLIGCLDTPSKGTIMIDKIDVSKLSSTELSHVRSQKIGFIFQSFNLINTLTALDNIALPIEFKGTSRSEAEKKASQLLETVGLGDRKNHYPSELSGGQIQRVAVARSLSNNPEIILADEPTGNLDSKSGGEIMKLMTDLNKKGKTIVLITHDEEYMSLGNKTFFLKDGELVKTKVKK